MSALGNLNRSHAMNRYTIVFGIQVGRSFTETQRASALANSAEELTESLPHLPLSPLRKRANAVKIHPEHGADEQSVHHVYQAWTRGDLPLAA